MVNQIFLNHLETISDCFGARTGVACTKPRRRKLAKKGRVGGSDDPPVSGGRAGMASARARVMVRTRGPALCSRLHLRPVGGRRRAGAPLLRRDLVRTLSQGRTHGRSLGGRTSQPADRETRL